MDAVYIRSSWQPYAAKILAQYNRLVLATLCAVLIVYSGMAIMDFGVAQVAGKTYILMLRRQGGCAQSNGR
jgi:hypothetical protein